MKNFKIKIIILCLSIFVSSSVFAKNVSLMTAESLVHVYLKEAFNLPNGPATKMSSFYIQGTGAFFILNCDLSFNAKSSNPFSSSKKAKSAGLPKDKIIKEMKNAILKAQEYIKIEKKDKVFLIIIDSKVFRSPFEKNLAKKIYKIGMESTNEKKTNIKEF